MRLLLDARYLSDTFSGIATYSRELIEHLSRCDAENEYLVLVRPSYDGVLDVGENFSLLSYDAPPVGWRTMVNLGRFVDSLNVDVMHSLFPLAPLFPIEPWQMDTPLIVTLHDLQPILDPEFSGQRPFPLRLAYNLFYRMAYPATFARAKWIICVSWYARNCMAELFPELTPKLIVVQSGLDAAMFEPTAQDHGDVLKRLGLTAPYLLYYGSTRPNKNLPTAVRAFAGYLHASGDEETDLVMILKQDRFYSEVEKVIASEGVTQRVIVLEQLPLDDQKAVLSEASVFLFPTKYEGFGFPPLEAMARGVPVIAGRSGALPETCRDAAEFVDPDDPTEIAHAIAHLLHDARRREQLIEQGRVRARGFDWAEAAEKVRDIYSLLL